MPILPTYPGVYIEEVPSGVRSITNVATSVAAFVDFFRRGPMNHPVQIFNMGDFEREFGGLDLRSEASYGIQQFFLNGGNEAWVVRVASPDGTNVPTSAAVYLDDVEQPVLQTSEAAAAALAALAVRANSAGRWGNELRVAVDGNTPVAGEFNLRVSETSTTGGRIVVLRQEIFRNLSMESAGPNFVDAVVNDANTGSKLVTVAARGSDAPLANGTLSGPHTTNPGIPTNPTVNVQISDGTTTVASGPVDVNLAAGAQPLTAVAPVLEAAIRSAFPANPAFASATVEVSGTRLRVLAGPGNPANRLSFVATQTSDALLFTNSTGASSNVQEYTLGGDGIANTAHLFGVAGLDGVEPDATALIGSLTAKTGIHALEEVDLFNLLCLPRAVHLPPAEIQTVLTSAQAYCERRRAFFLIDTPPGIDEPTEIRNQLSNMPRHRNSALYYPRVRVPDPLNNFRLRSLGASGVIAGLCARTDSTRGVWKAPAGTEAVLRNVSELEDVLTDAENGSLNPLAINCLRNFPIYGNVCWGARTLEGSDQQASEWKYVPVRRLALFLEESLYRGTQWVVFEPNDEPLWAQIRLNVGTFMHNLFRQGAFQGRTPREAYLVKCDKETTTQADIDLGIVNIVVGFAPLKPAEFVIIKIQQLTQQTEI